MRLPVRVSKHVLPIIKEVVALLEQEALGCTIHQSLILLLLSLHGDLLEGESPGLIADSHGYLIAELDAEPVGFKLLDESHHETHVHVLEHNVRSAQFFMVLKLEGSAHWIAR